MHLLGKFGNHLESAFLEPPPPGFSLPPPPPRACGVGKGGGMVEGTDQLTQHSLSGRIRGHSRTPPPRCTVVPLLLIRAVHGGGVGRGAGREGDLVPEPGLVRSNQLTGGERWRRGPAADGSGLTADLRRGSLVGLHSLRERGPSVCVQWTLL